MYRLRFLLFPFNSSSAGCLLRDKFFLMALAWLALSSPAQALLPPPPPDGGYPNFNTAEGDGALFSLTNGLQNTAIGFNALYTNTSGFQNTATGESALFSNTFGGQNTATGSQALSSNTEGNGNTANGASALFSNTTGNGNTANGFFALGSNSTGDSNVADGAFALFHNTTGDHNTADGRNALIFNTTGNENTAVGWDALLGNDSGNHNTALGSLALLQNTTGSFNTAEGFRALENSTGSNNTALGSNAGINLRTGDNNIYIGARGVAVESDTIRIGTAGVHNSAYIRGISGATVASGITVIVGKNGRLGTIQSSARFKEAIKPMDKASEAILNLKPVTFRYKEEIDPDKIPQFGLIAEQVEKVDPDLVLRDEDGKVSTVRYEAVNAMLLNEFMNEHGKVEEQEGRLRTQEAVIAKQQMQIEALTAAVQKVCDQIAPSKPPPQLVANP